jgi:hypothetical protein
MGDGNDPWSCSALLRWPVAEFVGFAIKHNLILP